MERFAKRKHLVILMLAAFSYGSAWANEATVADISPVRTLPSELKYSFNWWQPMVGANTAYTMGARGLGVTAAVIDTGIDLNNAEFKGRLVKGYNALSPTKTPMDDNGHGTHVAGIIGAAADGVMTVGIAPDVSLMPVKVLSSSGSGTQTSFNAGVSYAVNAGARILNMSLGASGPFGQAGIQQAVSAGRLVVAAAGNDGAANPAWPARYAKETWANGQVIAVGAVDANGVIASFSNRAGDTKNFFVVAPGVKIASTYLNNQYVYMSGTSMATPVVSGVAADIWSNWMYLTANQVSSIIFQTATHLGASPAGTPDAVYGWGLVNLTKALQPIGTLTVSTSSSGSKALSSSALSTNSLIKRSSFNGLSLVSTDDFGRAYSSDIGSLAIKQNVSNIDALFTSMDKQMSLVERTTDTSSLALSMYRSPTEVQQRGNPFQQPVAAGATMAGFNFTQKLGCYGSECQGEYAAGANGFADKYFGLSADYKTLPLSNSFANPYFQFASTASHLAMGYGIGAGYKLKMGLLSAASPLTAQPTLTYASTGSNGWVGEIEKRFDGATVLASVGGIRERQSLLGAAGTSAFAMDGAETRFVSFAGSYRLGSGTSLLAQVSTATTSNTGGGIFLGSQARTLSWSVGALRQDALRQGDKLAFSIAQPMKVTSGSMNMALPTVDMTTGQGGFNFSSINLASGRAETDFEIGYTAPVSKVSVLRLITAYKLNANNEPGDAKVLGARYQTTF